MSACEHPDYERVSQIALRPSIAEHTTFAWYVSVVRLPHPCSCFDPLTVLWCFSLSKYWSCQASISTRQVGPHSRWLPSVFECSGRVCKLAIRPDVAAAITFCGVFWSSVHPCVPSQVAPVSTRQVSLLSELLPSVVGYMGPVCKLAVRPDVAASISSNITFAACFGHRCIFSSQVKSLLFQHGKSVFIPDCCHRCLDACFHPQ